MIFNQSITLLELFKWDEVLRPSICTVYHMICIKQVRFRSQFIYTNTNDKKYMAVQIVILRRIEITLCMHRARVLSSRCLRFLTNTNLFIVHIIWDSQIEWDDIYFSRNFDLMMFWKQQIVTFTARGSTLDVRIWRLTSKFDPHTVRVNILLMAVDPQHRYSIEAEKTDWFQIEKILWSPWFIQKFVSALRVNIC